mmetsp:Transcript_16435/g.53684  ORF Transcript_16435/g.53684 Transcript_16435/m.53684 type:complete len:439 (-) Transcript_16435:11-1327(-)
MEIPSQEGGADFRLDVAVVLFVALFEGGWRQRRPRPRGHGRHGCAPVVRGRSGSGRPERALVGAIVAVFDERRDALILRLGRALEAADPVREGGDGRDERLDPAHELDVPQRLVPLALDRRAALELQRSRNRDPVAALAALLAKAPRHVPFDTGILSLLRVPKPIDVVQIEERVVLVLAVVHKSALRAARLLKRVPVDAADEAALLQVSLALHLLGPNLVEGFDNLTSHDVGQQKAPQNVEGDDVQAADLEVRLLADAVRHLIPREPFRHRVRKHGAYGALRHALSDVHADALVEGVAVLAREILHIVPQAVLVRGEHVSEADERDDGKEKDDENPDEHRPRHARPADADARGHLLSCVRVEQKVDEMDGVEEGRVEHRHERRGGEKAKEPEAVVRKDVLERLLVEGDGHADVQQVPHVLVALALLEADDGALLDEEE